MITIATLLLRLIDYIEFKINELFFQKLHFMRYENYTNDNKTPILNCNTLKIVSYNINNFYNIIWKNKRKNIINYIKNCNAEVICLQECKENIYEEIKSIYKGYIQVGEQIILSKHNLVDYYTTLHTLIKHRKYIKTPIVKLEMYIDNKRTDVLIANIHFNLDITLNEQYKHFNELLTYIEKKCKDIPFILTGDTNLPEIKNIPCNVLTYNTSNTFPTICPLLALDRIFYSDLKLISCKVDTSIKNSDHYPLISEFILK